MYEKNYFGIQGGGEFKLGCLTTILILIGGCMIYSYMSARSHEKFLQSLPPEERAKVMQQEMQEREKARQQDMERMEWNRNPSR